MDRGALCLQGWNKLPYVFFSRLGRLSPTAGPRQSLGGRGVGKVLGRTGASPLRVPHSPQYLAVASEAGAGRSPRNNLVLEDSAEGLNLGLLYGVSV